MSKSNNINNVTSNIKKKPLNNRKKVIAITVVSLFLIYCIFLLVKLVINPTNTFIVENGKIYKEESAVGYILRDEQIVQNENANIKIVHLKDEGEKIAKGEAIYRYSVENESELNQKIKELDVKITEAMQKENSLFSTDLKLLENQIEEQLVNVYECTNIQQINHYKKEINNSITKKAKITGELAPSGSYIKNLIGERVNCENLLNSNSQYIYANKSGIISYRVDNLESSLTVTDFSYLNKDFLESLNLKTSQFVATSSNNAKIINNFRCYITSISKSKEALECEVGTKIKLRLPNSEEIPAEIVYKNNENDKEVLLVFEIEQSVEKLINYRKIAFDIIWWSDSGIKIPNSALYYEGKFAYVLRNRAGYEEKILVKVLRQNEDYSIVENYSTAELQSEGYDISTIENKKSISMYDEIVINKK